MLNTDSRLAAGLIWLAIVGIAGKAAWTLAALGSPADVHIALADGALGAFLTRNAVMVTGLLGFGGLALAHIFNGWRDRAERRHAGERAEQKLAAVMSREALNLAAGFDAVLASGNAVQAKTALGDAIAMADGLVIVAPLTEVAHLGAGATAAIQALRRKFHHLVLCAEASDGGGHRAVQVAAAEASFAARDAVRVLDALRRKGAAAADGLRLMPRSELEIAALVRDLAGDTVSAARRQPAA